jgi:hypothetical protein
VHPGQIDRSWEYLNDNGNWSVGRFNTFLNLHRCTRSEQQFALPRQDRVPDWRYPQAGDAGAGPQLKYEMRRCVQKSFSSISLDTRRNEPGEVELGARRDIETDEGGEQGHVLGIGDRPVGGGAEQVRGRSRDRRGLARPAPVYFDALSV